LFGACEKWKVECLKDEICCCDKLGNPKFCLFPNLLVLLHFSICPEMLAFLIDAASTK
jgi:hypothetical protein